jgi:hypothetical protein|tara:strand:+ start:31 stop:177 length:147 start_codon:yes stop_codon:yes gene_type:complete
MGADWGSTKNNDPIETILITPTPPVWVGLFTHAKNMESPNQDLFLLSK